jgi:Ca2+-binding EF-hand superfamily protein
MTSPMLKVLGELSNEDHKALLIELPDNALNDLMINQDGTIDTQELLKFLIELSKQDPKQSEGLSLHEEIELMLNIYDESRAASFANKARSIRTG